VPPLHYPPFKIHAVLSMVRQSKRQKEKKKNSTLSEKKKEVSILKIEKGRRDEE
jgi:hypothetical protein